MSLHGDFLASLAAPPVGRCRRVSSNEQPNWNDGNLDMTWFAPGQLFELPELRGPGVIEHIWMTSHAGGVGELDSLRLRFYWDGREEPGVDVPLGQFFAVGNGAPVVVESLPVQVSPSGSLTCYWRMPFARSARITVANENPDRSTGLYWQVDWRELPALPPETGYFHARYRQEYPAVMGRDYLIADLAGKGQYVGTVMSVTMAQDGWFGEGDDFFYIDGEEVPSLQGTGSEDYFNDAWGFRRRTSLWFGQPRWQGWSAGDGGICYRWHVLDPVGFSRSLRVTMEHKGNRPMGEEAWYIERPDFFSSIAYWYQTGEPKPFGHVPSWHERRVPWETHHLVRAFCVAHTSDDSRPAVRTEGFFGGRPMLAWENPSDGARLTLPFTVAADGRYALRLTAATAPEHGTFDVELDGKLALVRASFGSAEWDETDLLLGTHTLSAGEHTLGFHAVSPAGARCSLAVETLRLLRLPPEAARAVKTDYEGRFIRLGIGRAVYAHRLAYDRLPDSLDELVATGIMDAYYLQDENRVPLRARRDGEYFVVESDGPNAWRHRWQGLDARR
jgi:Protein of unknown function (DUF2961)